jgi:hypothetical protein
MNLQDKEENSLTCNEVKNMVETDVENENTKKYDIEADNYRLAKKICQFCESIEDKEKGYYLFERVNSIFIHPLEEFLQRRKHNEVENRLLSRIGIDDSLMRKQHCKLFFNVFVVYGYLFYFLHELYTTSVSIFLILFVQQNCGNDACGLFENIFTGNKLNDATFIISLMTFAFYFAMSNTEARREHFLRTCFTINKTSPGILGISENQISDVDDLENRIETENDSMEKDRENNVFHGVFVNKKHPIYNNNFTNFVKKKLESFHKIYGFLGIHFLGFYVINLILSSTTILLNNSKNQKTYFSLITNTVLFLPRLYHIVKFVMLEKADTYSRFIKTYAEYNNYNEDAFQVVENEVLRNGINYLVWGKYDNFFRDENRFSEDDAWEKYCETYDKIIHDENWRNRIHEGTLSRENLYTPMNI